MKTVHVIVEGKVQGVFYRDYTLRQASGLNLNGWVRNSPDGSVEAVLSGKTKQVNAMLEWMQMGSPLSDVTMLKVEEVLPTENIAGFEIRYAHKR